MKSSDEIQSDLEALEASHYYSEDFEWLSSVRAYRERLAVPERALLERVVLTRLLRNGSMTDILLCSIVPAPEAASVLAAKLDRESVPSQLTRALLSALQHYSGDDVFRAVARFVDSDQESEALRALARIHFHRALPFLARAIQKPHQGDLILHLLHERVKTIGLPGLVLELRVFAAGWHEPDLLERIRRALCGKAEPYNPFTADELRQLAAGLANP